VTAIWHDLECGGYAEDLELWRSLAVKHGDPVLDIGAGTGRIALHLARQGYRVTALDHDALLASELARRARGLNVCTVVADARRFDLGRRFPLCIVPMQTIQLLTGRGDRTDFLRCARRHLLEKGLLAVAITETLELFEVVDGDPAPPPETRELDGVVYSSQPLAVRADRGGFVLERRRETVTASGERTRTYDAVHLDGLTSDQLEREAADVGLRLAGRASVPETRDYSGSTVVMLRA
jgi:SAM-dependent methyltransferase